MVPATIQVLTCLDLLGLYAHPRSSHCGRMNRTHGLARPGPCTHPTAQGGEVEKGTVPSEPQKPRVVSGYSPRENQGLSTGRRGLSVRQVEKPTPVCLVTGMVSLWWVVSSPNPLGSPSSSLWILWESGTMETCVWVPALLLKSCVILDRRVKPLWVSVYSSGKWGWY